jgi:hypothetical protein
MDYVLWNLGLYRPHANATGKLALLTRVGASAPSILLRLIRQRNLLEHEYKNIQRADADDAVDIADLFVQATSLISNLRHDNWQFWSSRSKIGGDVAFGYGKGIEEAEPNNPELTLCDDASPESPPTFVRYSLYCSTRSDNEDPLELLEEWMYYRDLPADLRPTNPFESRDVPPQEYLSRKHEFGFKHIGNGVVRRDQDDDYCNFVRIMVTGMKEPL